MSWGMSWKKIFGVALIVKGTMLAIANIAIGSISVRDASTHHFVSMVPLFLLIGSISYFAMDAGIWKVVRSEKVSRCLWVVFVCWHCLYHVAITVFVYSVVLGQPSRDMQMDDQEQVTSYEDHRELLIGALVLVSCGLVYIALTLVWLWAVACFNWVPYREMQNNAQNSG